MLEKIRENAQGKIAWAIVIIICSTFVLWGITDYFTQDNSPTIAAKVNGEKITWQSVDLNYQRTKERFEAAGVAANLAKEHIRAELIRKTLLLNNARALGLRVTDEQVAFVLLQIPVFQVEGKFSKDRYLDILSRANYTDVTFRQDLAKDVLTEQLKEGIAQSSFILPSESNRVIELAEQNRDFGYAILPLEKFKSGIKVTPEQINSYYIGQKTQFIKPEQVSLEYVELSLDDVASQVEIPEPELKAYYQEHIHSYSAPERLHARHILIPTTKEDDAKAKTKATEILIKVRAGSDFESLAKMHSIDLASAGKGGDIGWFTRGQMVPAFEDAAFGLHKPQDVAGPIQTQYGYHIIQLIERKSAETRPFEEVRSFVREQQSRDKAQEIFNEKIERLSKLAFEAPKSLDLIARELDLKIKETELFSQKTEKNKNEKESAAGISAYPAIQKAAFSDVVLTKKNNSELIQIDNNAVVVVRLKKHEPAVQLTLKQVENEIRDSIIFEKSQQAAKELVESLQKRIKSGEEPAVVMKGSQWKWEKKTGITHKNTIIDQNILIAAFQTPYKKEGKSISIVSLSSGDIALLILDKVTLGNLDTLESNIKDDYQRSLLQMSANLEFNSYLDRIIKDSKIVIPKEATDKH
jgi:peptidyl-prolyl cis-trans isomerase D